MALPAALGAMPAGAAGGQLPGGVVPVRLRTPSGKTALFYANMLGAAGPCIGGMTAPAADVAPPVTKVSPVASVEESPETAASEASGTEEPRSAVADEAAGGELMPESVRWPHSAPEDGTSVESPKEIATDTILDEAIGAVAKGSDTSGASQVLLVGDVVYRNGELASVVHVDSSIHPPSYVIRLAQTGQELSCEAEHLQLAFPRVMNKGCSGSTDSDELNHASAVPAEAIEATFADVVQMQNAQQVHLMDPQQQQLQMQMQQMHAQQMHAQQLQQMYHMQSQSLWPDQGLSYPEEAYSQTMERYYQMYQTAGAQMEAPYDMQQLQGLPDVVTDPTYANMAQMQHQDFASPNMGGHVENHALKAVAEALDRAEVNMLTGGRRCCSPPQPGLDLGNGSEGSQFPPLAADDVPRGASMNFALQAAADALATCSSDDMIRGGSMNFALKAAADALGAMDHESSLAARLGRASPQVGNFDGSCSVDHSSHFAGQLVASSETSANRYANLFSQGMEVGSTDNCRFSVAGESPLPGRFSIAGESPLPGKFSIAGESSLQEIATAAAIPQVSADFNMAPIRSISPPDRSMDLLQTAIGDLSGTAAILADDDDEELERMAKMEMEQEDDFDFSGLASCLPTQPQKVEPVRSLVPPAPEAPSVASGRSSVTSARDSPQMQFAKPGLPSAPIPPMGPAPVRSRPSSKPRESRPSSKPRESKDRYMERDLLVECILSDEPARRASTPRGSRLLEERTTSDGGRITPRATTPRGSTPRSSSRGPSVARSSVSQSRDVRVGGKQHANRAPPRPHNIVNFGTGKPPQHVLDVLHFESLDAGDKPRAKKISHLDDYSCSDASSGSSLPQLIEKRPSQCKAPPTIHKGSKSARNWSLYA